MSGFPISTGIKLQLRMGARNARTQVKALNHYALKVTLGKYMNHGSRMNVYS